MTSSLWPAIALVAVCVLGLSILQVAGMGAARTHREPVDSRAAELLAAGFLPLSDCPRDQNACLRCLLVDRCVVHRLLEMGLTPGTEVRIVQDAGGPMLVSVRGSRVALGRDLAERMWVELPAPVPVKLPKE